MPAILDFDTITVSTTAVPLTAAKVAAISPALNTKGGASNVMVLISPNAFAIRFRTDGVAPTSTVGHYLGVGDLFELNAYDMIQGLLMIRDTTATGDANVSVTYRLSY